MLLSRDQATSIIFVGSKGHTTFMCGLISFDLGSDYSYKFPLHPLCKGEALELFSVGKQLISSQNRDLFPLLLRCRSLFIHSLIQSIYSQTKSVDNSSRMKKRMNNMTKWISTQLHNLLLTKRALDCWLTDGTERTYSMSTVVQQVGFD